MKFNLKYTTLSLLGVVGAYLIWGAVIEPYLIDKQEEIATIPNLPPVWEGKKVAVISDFQVGIWGDNTSTIRRIVTQLVELRPTAVLITGDFIYEPGNTPSQELSKVTYLVRPLSEAGIPTYAVLGNHDYRLRNSNQTSDDHLSTQVRQALEAAGVQVLKNEAVTLKLPENPLQTQAKTDEKALYLVGIGSHRAQQDKPKVALAQVPDKAPRIVMMHNPNSFDALPPGTAPLAVAGHTHGGQIRLLPFAPVWTLLTYDEQDLVHVAGWIENYGKPGNHLYVNRGIGFSRVPIRINAPPEVTVFTLQSTF